jgi:hypothetical protein
MEKKMNIRKFMVAALALATMATAAFAQTGHSGSCLCGKIAGTKAAWQIEGNAQLQSAAGAEFDRWNKYVNVFTYAQGDGTAGMNNGKNEIVFATLAQAQQGWGLDLDGDTFGIAPSSPQSAFGSPGFNACPVPALTQCGTFTESDVIVNAEFSRGFITQGPPDFDDANGPALYGATAVHELGHTLGFHHNFNNLSVMNYYQDFAAQYITATDVLAARAQYGAQTQNVTDMAIYPFIVDPAKQQYEMTNMADISVASVAPGGTINLHNLMIENIGTTALSNVQWRFYLSTDANITTSDILLGGASYTSFPNAAFDDDGGEGIDLVVPANTPAGNYFVGSLVTYNTTSLDTIPYNNSFVIARKLTVTGGTTQACTGSASQLLLNNNRFRINANWKDFQGNTGCGVPVKLTSDTGYFWFFASTNVELVVKALDGHPVNGKWWIFYGALSNVEYTMNVTDTVTGITKQYKNASGNFASVGDTNAFN